MASPLFSFFKVLPISVIIGSKSRISQPGYASFPGLRRMLITHCHFNDAQFQFFCNDDSRSSGSDGLIGTSIVIRLGNPVHKHSMQLKIALFQPVAMNIVALARYKKL